MTLGLNRNYEPDTQQDEHPLARATRKAAKAVAPEATEEVAEDQGIEEEQEQSTGEVE